MKQMTRFPPAKDAGVPAMQTGKRAELGLGDELLDLPGRHAVIAVAEAAGIFAKRMKASDETLNYATEIRLRAERKLGEILKASPKATGSAGTGSNQHRQVRSQNGTTPTHAQLGIDKKLAARAQALAHAPEPASANDRLAEPPPPRAGRKKLKPADAPRVFTYLAECPKCQSTRLKSTGRASDGGLYAFCRDCRQIVVHYRVPISELEIIQSE